MRYVDLEAFVLRDGRSKGVQKSRERGKRSRTEIVTYFDGIAFDVSKRQQVFKDTGLGSGASLIGALWSELGRLERESREQGFTTGWKATGTGIVVEQSQEVPGTGNELGEGKDTTFSTKASTYGGRTDRLPASARRQPLRPCPSHPGSAVRLHACQTTLTLSPPNRDTPHSTTAR